MSRADEEAADAKNTPIQSFKHNADLGFLREMLIDGFKKRVTLYGASEVVVRQCIEEFINESFATKYTLLKNSLRFAVRVNDFLVPLKIQFLNYLMKPSQVDIYQFLLKQVNNVLKRRGIAPLMQIFKAYHIQGKELIRSKVDQKELQKYEYAWEIFLTDVAQKQLLAEQILRTIPSFERMKVWIPPIVACVILAIFNIKFIRLRPPPSDELLQVMEKEVGLAFSAGIVAALVISLIATYILKVIVKVDFHVLDANEFSEIMAASNENYLIAQHAKLHVNELPLFQLIFPAPSPQIASVASDEEEVAVVRKPKRRDVVSAGVAGAAAAAGSGSSEAAAAQQVFQLDQSTYVRLHRCPQGIFYHHNADTQRVRLDRKSGQEDQLLDALGTIVTDDPNIYEESHRGSGIKRVGVSEKNFKGQYKIRLDGRSFGSLRIDVKGREPTQAERGILGDDFAEILTPIGIVPK